MTSVGCSRSPPRRSGQPPSPSPSSRRSASRTRRSSTSWPSSRPPLVAGTRGRHRRRGRLVPPLRLLLHRARLHVHGPRPGGVAEPRPAAVRRDRRRPAGRARSGRGPSVARAREREARALFQVSRALATRESTPAVLPGDRRDPPRRDGAWTGSGSRSVRTTPANASPPTPDRTSGRRRAASSASSSACPATSRPSGSASTSRPCRAAASPARPSRPTASGSRPAATALGSIWALRDRGRPASPDRTETRLLAAAADQIGQALAHDRLAAEAQAAEIARQSDALKSALLQSVSHDLRTPLATIRAAAGTLRPGAGAEPEDQRESAEAIDREVEYLNRLVTNLLDLSRIEAGRPARRARRLRARRPGRPDARAAAAAARRAGRSTVDLRGAAGRWSTRSSSTRR